MIHHQQLLLLQLIKLSEIASQGSSVKVEILSPGTGSTRPFYSIPRLIFLAHGRLQNEGRALYIGLWNQLKIACLHQYLIRKTVFKFTCQLLKNSVTDFLYFKKKLFLSWVFYCRYSIILYRYY